jgi:hypothetical protein
MKRIVQIKIWKILIKFVAHLKPIVYKDIKVLYVWRAIIKMDIILKEFNVKNVVQWLTLYYIF